MPTVKSIPQLLTTLPRPFHPIHLTTLNAHTSFKLATISGPFIWHSHPATDEVFYVVSSTSASSQKPLKIELCTSAADPDEAEKMGASEVAELGVGDMFLVPKGVQHRPVAEGEVGVMLIEAVGTVNTGDRQGDAGAEGRTVLVDEGKGNEG